MQLRSCLEAAGRHDKAASSSWPAPGQAAVPDGMEVYAPAGGKVVQLGRFLSLALTIVRHLNPLLIEHPL